MKRTAKRKKAKEASEQAKMMLLPPPKDTCQVCAVKHDPRLLHNQQSLFYRYHFYAQHERWPTWKDAMAHCSDEVKAAAIAALKKQGVEV